MSFKGLPAPPPGWRRSLLRDGDSLASLVRELRVSLTVLLEHNGVPSRGRLGTCAWGNDIGDMVEAGGGVVVGEDGRPARRDRSKCGRDTRFRAGFVLNLPTGSRPPAPAGPALPSPPPTKVKSGGGLGVGLLVAGALAALPLLFSSGSS